MEAERFDRSIARYEIAATKTWTSLGWLNFGQGLIFGIGMTITMWMSAREVMAGTQSIGDFVFINAMLMQLSVPLNFIGFIYREIRQGLTDIEQMFDLLDVPQEVDRPSRMRNRSRSSEGRVEFRDVHFAYDADRPILKGITFKVPAGKTVAIVGPSGAGKSTVSRLLFRFYDIQQGRHPDRRPGRSRCHAGKPAGGYRHGSAGYGAIQRYDRLQHPLRPPRRDGRRGQASGRPCADRRFHRGACLAGYKSMVGERGLKLSGGEKQRVAIARTILKAPPILMLDEATSALDTQTEQEIQAALDLVSRGRTTIVIAHRLVHCYFGG